jgi:hypothetical protein
MDYYGQGAGPSPVGEGPALDMTVDKVCKLLRSAKPLVWSVAIVFGLLGVTLTVRYLWREKRAPQKQQSVSAEGIWMRS